MSELAPVSISVYTRLKHFSKCINSLKRNELARETVLYIFSDGPKKGDEEKVSKVREYAKNISGFKEVIIAQQKTNNFEKNTSEFLKIPLSKHGKIILMEDDVIVSPYFLNFMNDALNYYEKEKKVFCVSGYVWEGIERKDSNTAMGSFVINASGIAFWKDKYSCFESDFEEMYPWQRMKINSKYLWNFFRAFGIPALALQKLIYLKKLFYGDILWGEYIFRKNMITVMPPITLTLNRGYDGTGVNCKNDIRMNTQGAFTKLHSDISFPDVFDQESVKKNSYKYASQFNGTKSQIIGLWRLLKI